MRTHFRRVVAVLVVVMPCTVLRAQTQPQPPSERDAQQSLVMRATEESKGKLRLVSFRKTDGVRREIAGTPVYQLEFEAEIQVLDELKWLTAGVFQPVFQGFATSVTKSQAEKDGGFWSGWYNMTQQSGLELHRGSKVRVAGTLTYEKTERGWRAVGAPSMKALKPGEQVASSTASGSGSAPPSSTPQPIPRPTSRPTSVSSLEELVPGSSLGDFQHGTLVTGCYSATQLIDIQLRGRPFSKVCARTRLLVHAGVDIVAPRGAEVRAFADGSVSDVISVETDPSFKTLGYAVVIQHIVGAGEKPTWSLYLHLDSPPAVFPGDAVLAGKSVVGKVGMSGTALGYHTHFEVRHFAERVSPRWRNIYAVEAPPAQGGTFDQSTFVEDWANPLQFLGAQSVAGGQDTSAVTPAVEGYRLYAAGEFSQAAEKFAQAAAVGDARAAGFLGFMYKSGSGVMQDFGKAIELFKQSADAGEAGSAFNLGDMYAKGEGVRRSRDTANEWYARALKGYAEAAAGGELDAMATMGRMYSEALGTPQNHALALEWLKRASDSGHPRATRLLGEMYLNGSGVRRDRTEALRLIRVAAQKGDQMARRFLRDNGEVW